jgi:hypothetical protein
LGKTAATRGVKGKGKGDMGGKGKGKTTTGGNSKGKAIKGKTIRGCKGGFGKVVRKRRVKWGSKLITGMISRRC